jgi:hypothetical protein
LAGVNREEFLKQLQEALVGRVPDQVVQENIIYYRRYISEQISGGKSEPEVLRMLGDPRLLAKTIEGTSKFASNMGETQKDYSGYTNSSFNFNSSYNNSDYGYEQGRNTKQFRMPLWAVLCIVLVVFVLILTLAFRVFVFLAPFILMVMVATFVVRIVRNWIGKF